jgi:hypothetical protein
MILAKHRRSLRRPLKSRHLSSQSWPTYDRFKAESRFRLDRKYRFKNANVAVSIVRFKRMKPSPIMIAVAYAAAILQMLVVFHKPIGIPDFAADTLQIVSLAFWAVFFILWKRMKSSVPAGAGSTVSPQSKKMVWLTLSVLIIASLSSIFWLPYTGVVLPFSQLVVVSIVGCVFSVTVFLIARKIMRPKV